MLSKKGEKKKTLLLLMTEQVQAALRTKQAGEPAGHTAGIALHKDHLHTRVDIMLDYNGLNVNRRLFCSPSDEEWGSRSCRHRSLFPLSVPRQPGNWSSPWLRGSGAVTARLSIRCRWLHSRAVLTIAGHLSQTDPLLSLTGRPLLCCHHRGASLFLSLPTGSVLFLIAL